MSAEYGHLAQCLELQDRDVADGLATRERAQSLLAHLASISAPNTGVAKALLVFARMATSACDWIEGDLSVDLFGEGETTVVEASTGLGGGLRERLFSPLTFRAPIAEFARAIERVPHMIAPLAVRARSSRRVSLSVTEMIRRTTAPPPPIAISGDSLFVAPAPMPVPEEAAETAATLVLPNDIDAGWDS